MDFLITVIFVWNSLEITIIQLVWNDKKHPTSGVVGGGGGSEHVYTIMRLWMGVPMLCVKF